jgi:hypothetical protein
MEGQLLIVRVYGAQLVEEDKVLEDDFEVVEIFEDDEVVGSLQDVDEEDLGLVDDTSAHNAIRKIRKTFESMMTIWSGFSAA